MKILLLGATGATGELVLKELVKRGLNPVLVGRNKSKLAKLQEQYPDLEIAVANAQNKESLESIVSAGDILLSTVGPFSLLGKIPLQVATDKGAHYIDPAGEPEFNAYVYREYESKMNGSDSVVITSCGYDYVPGQLAAGKLLQQYGDKISKLNITYSSGDGEAVKMTSGTIASMNGGIADKGTFFNEGRWYEDFIGKRLHEIAITPTKTIQGMSVSGSECYELPRMHPALKDVNVHLAWFADKAAVMSRISRITAFLFKIPGMRNLLRGIGRRLPVPENDPTVTDKNDGSTLIVAEAYDDRGVHLGECRVKGHNMYCYTGEIMAWVASQISEGNIQHTGVVGPLRAFGLEALEKGNIEIGYTIETL